MKLSNVYKLFILALLYVGLQSRSTGPATSNQMLEVTGAPGSTNAPPGTCANTGCHNPVNFDPSASIQLLDGSNVVTEYEPGKAYTLRISIVPGNGTPARYGFQAVALNGSDNQAGSWGTLGSGQQVAVLSNRDYLEHSLPSSENIFESEWVAPAVGTGDVTFYAAGVAANGAGGSTGDGVANTTLDVTESPINSTADANGGIASFDIFPNPVADVLNLQINSRINGDFKLRIMDVTGKVTSQTAISLQNGQQVTNVPVGNLNPGLYVVQLCGEDHLAAVQMLKK